MIFSTLQQSISSTVLAAYRAGGRFSTVFAYRAGGRLQADVLALYRGQGRFAVMGGYRGSEHSLCFAFITTRTNGYPVLSAA